MGCASTPTPNPWADIEKPALTAERPLELPDVPQPVAVDREVGTVTYDTAGMREWENYVDFAEANTVVADANASALVEQKRAVGHLVDAGSAQRARAPPSGGRRGGPPAQVPVSLTFITPSSLTSTSSTSPPSA